MTQEQYLEICKSHFESISKLDGVDSFYEREKQFVAVMQTMNRQVFEKSISDVTADRRKKKRSASTGS